MEEMHFTQADIDKFKLKNDINIKKLYRNIDCRRSEIQLILTSSVMFEYLKILDGSEFDETHEILKFRGKRVITNDYIPTHQIHFVMKANRIGFDLPCICGIYYDEKHP
jgi:hypothetical protein